MSSPAAETATVAPGGAALRGKALVVTGGARGLGRAIVEQAAREGARVHFLFHASAAAATTIVNMLDEEGHRVTGHACDVRDAAALALVLQAIEEQEGRIDGLVNNAGVNRPGLLLATPDEAMAEQLAVNLMAPMVASRAVLTGMIRRRSGVIVQIGSVAASKPFRGQTVYAATKGALESFTRALAVEVAARGVRVLCVAPGPVQTDMLASALDPEEARRRTPTGRIAEPVEVARLVTFLLSDAASAMTGVVVPADLGYSLG